MAEKKVLEEDIKSTLGCPPVHPLPDEIQQMESSETVCRYCGVSYLILHEFHKLQSQLAQLEAELQCYRGEARREKARREALESGRWSWERDLLARTEEREKHRQEEWLVLREAEVAAAAAETLREEFSREKEKIKGKLEDELERRAGERERSLREELGKLAEAREKVVCDQLQQANKELEDQSKCCRQLEESEQRKQTETLLSQQRDSEEEYREHVLRLSEELKEKDEMWLSCQHRCDSLQEKLLVWQQREEQATLKCCAAEEEVMSMRKSLVQAQQEASEMRRESERMVESHSRALTRMEEECRQQLAIKLTAALEDQRAQNALHLKEKRAELCKEVQLELIIDREKSQLLLQRCQRDSTQLHRKLKESQKEVQRLQEELEQERQSREDERKDRRRTEERIQERIGSQQQVALQLSHTKHELELLKERNTELQEEVALLEDIVGRECEERGELTAALTQAQEHLLGLRASASRPHPQASRPHPPSGGGAEEDRRDGGEREAVRESVLAKLSANRMSGGKRNTMTMARRDRL